jgi:hypothetical protein
MKEKKETLVRINTRVPREQKKWIKSKAKELKIGEGDLHRIIIDHYMNIIK